jgi:hypothetical protein
MQQKELFDWILHTLQQFIYDCVFICQENDVQ